MSSSGDDDS